MKPRVLVTGAGGQLGSAMAARLERDADVVALTRAELDVSDANAVLHAIGSRPLDLVVNCSAYNMVDDAEDRAGEALSVNALGVHALARAAASAGAAFVHYSTDFVFDGNIDRSYVEDDPPAPLSTYGLSKLLGEWLANTAIAELRRSRSTEETEVRRYFGGRHYVLRVESLFGGTRAKSSIDRILANLKEGREVRVFVDRTVTPSYVPDVVDATLTLLRRNAPGGLYHCVNSGVTTWLDVAREAAKLLGVEGNIVGVKVADMPMKAARPQRCALSNEKLRAAGYDMPSWQDALRRHVSG